MKKIAIEEHFSTPEHQERLRSVRTKGNLALYQANLMGGDDMAPTYGSKLLDVEEGRLAEMDALGIDMEVLSLTVPGVQEFDASTALEVARSTNDFLAGTVSRHPGRYAGLAVLPVQTPEVAAGELRRAVGELGLKGAIINSNTNGEYLDDRKFWPIFETAEKLDVPVYLHPREPSPDMIKPYLAYPGLASAMCGFGAETHLHALRLICSGVFDEYPGLKIVLGHLGEALPFWMWRIDNFSQKGDLRRRLKRRPSEYIKNNFYVTTSGMFWEPVLNFVRSVLGTDRVLFAVDRPYESSREGVEFINSVTMPESDKEKVCHLNAERLFRL